MKVYNSATGRTEDVVTLSGQILEEQQTEADAVNGVLTFSENLSKIEIFNTDTVNTGIFTVNGIEIRIPPSTPFEATIGGTSGNTVTVTGSTSYIVSRYV